jgi:hypothetical protein
MQEKELYEIWLRCSRTRPGPWQTERNNFVKAELIPDESRIVWGHYGEVAYVPSQGPDGGNAEAAFIAHARSDIPRLLEEIHRLRVRLMQHHINPDR